MADLEIDALRSTVDETLEDVLSSHADGLDAVGEAMRYSVQGGDRWRPILLAQTGMIYGRGLRELMPAGAAVEFLHSASIILDDMPCMDNSTRRRGQSACWVKHGEATTLMASICLQMLAADTLAQSWHEAGCDPAIDPASRVRALTCEMVKGQNVDLRLGKKDAKGPEAEQLLIQKSAAKTGLLIRLAVEVGAVMGNAPAQHRRELDEFAYDLGLAYQFFDDVSDCTTNAQPSELPDKPIGQDRRNCRLTAVTVYGLDGAQLEATARLDSACVHLQQTKGSRELVRTAQLLCHRPLASGATRA